jgi:uncharacterized membrane protein
MKLKSFSPDKIFELLAPGMLFSIWAVTIVSYPNLPETIPMHYNAAGEVDGYGEKHNIWTLPIVSTGLFLLLTLLIKFLPNFPSIRNTSSVKQNLNVVRWMRYLNVIIFLLILLKIIWDA